MKCIFMKIHWLMIVNCFYIVWGAMPNATGCCLIYTKTHTHTPAPNEHCEWRKKAMSIRITLTEKMHTNSVDFRGYWDKQNKRIFFLNYIRKNARICCSYVKLYFRNWFDYIVRIRSTSGNWILANGCKQPNSRRAANKKKPQLNRCCNFVTNANTLNKRPFARNQNAKCGIGGI